VTPAATQLGPTEQEAFRSAARAKLAIDHLEDFVRQAWPIIEPSTPLVWNWHISLICDVLEKLTRGELRHPDGRLVREVLICIPPGMMKSRLVSVLWPAWQWLQRPTERLLCLSNDDDLVKRDSGDSRDVIQSLWYQSLVRLVAEAQAIAGGDMAEDAEPWGLKDDQNRLINFGTTVHGFRQCKPIGGNVTGKRGHGVLIDDPYDAKEALLGSVRQVRDRMLAVVKIYTGVLSSRLNDKRTGYRVTIMQRLHELDLAGHLLKTGAYAVVLPMEFDPDHPHRNPADPRTEPGELLFPERFPRDVVDDIKAEMGARDYGAQYQQRPSPVAGGIYQRAWFRQFYRTDPQRMVMDEWAITVDATFKGLDHNDFVAMHVWGRRKLAEFYLLDRVHARMTYTQSREALRMLCYKWPQVVLKLIEEKANGPALIDDLKETIPGLVPYDPKLSKAARAQLAARFYEAGNVWLPDPELCPWVLDFIEEHVGFGAGAAHDDDVDAGGQILLYWNAGAGVDPLAEVRGLYGFLSDY
jgi:predicted phage terminase large subunit-like protein